MNRPVRAPVFSWRTAGAPARPWKAERMARTEEEGNSMVMADARLLWDFQRMGHAPRPVPWPSGSGVTTSEWPT